MRATLNYFLEEYVVGFLLVGTVFVVVLLLLFGTFVLRGLAEVYWFFTKKEG